MVVLLKGGGGGKKKTFFAASLSLAGLIIIYSIFYFVLQTYIPLHINIQKSLR